MLVCDKIGDCRTVRVHVPGDFENTIARSRHILNPHYGICFSLLHTTIKCKAISTARCHVQVDLRVLISMEDNCSL